jgi:hypothetical protein
VPRLSNWQLDNVMLLCFEKKWTSRKERVGYLHIVYAASAQMPKYWIAVTRSDIGASMGAKCLIPFQRCSKRSNPASTTIWLSFFGVAWSSWGTSAAPSYLLMSQKSVAHEGHKSAHRYTSIGAWPQQTKFAVISSTTTLITTTLTALLLAVC